MNQQASQRLVILLVLSLCGVGVWWKVLAVEKVNSGLLEIHFFDVGQGDATFIESPEGVQVLIDGGKDSSVLRELSSKLGFFDRTLDLIVATHEDMDHIGGLIDVLERYEVKTILISDNQNDNATAALWRRLANEEGSEIIWATAGQVLTLGASTTLMVLFPDRPASGFESNAASIIIQLQYGEVGMMLTGDAPKSIEEYLVRQHGEALESEILKIGHHGSDTSTAEAFVSAVDPIYTVISAGCGNRYGHPHDEVVERIDHLEVFSTCDDGTVSFLSDGTTVWQNN